MLNRICVVSRAPKPVLWYFCPANLGFLGAPMASSYAYVRARFIQSCLCYKQQILILLYLNVLHAWCIDLLPTLPCLITLILPSAYVHAVCQTFTWNCVARYKFIYVCMYVWTQFPFDRVLCRYGILSQGIFTWNVLQARGPIHSRS